MNMSVIRRIGLCWALALICGLAGTACQSSTMLPEKEAERLQRLVVDALGGLQSGSEDALKACGWENGLSEARRIQGNINARRGNGLYQTLIGNEYTPTRLIVRPGRRDECVVLTRPYAEVTEAKGSASTPYAFLAQKKDGIWIIRDSRFVPDDFSDEGKPDVAFGLFKQ